MEILEGGHINVKTRPAGAPLRPLKYTNSNKINEYRGKGI